MSVNKVQHSKITYSALLRHIKSTQLHQRAPYSIRSTSAMQLASQLPTEKDLMSLAMPPITARAIDITKSQPPFETDVTALSMPLPRADVIESEMPPSTKRVSDISQEVRKLHSLGMTNA